MKVINGIRYREEDVARLRPILEKAMTPRRARVANKSRTPRTKKAEDKPVTGKDEAKDTSPAGDAKTEKTDASKKATEKK